MGTHTVSPHAEAPRGNDELGYVILLHTAGLPSQVNLLEVCGPFGIIPDMDDPGEVVFQLTWNIVLVASVDVS